MADSVKLEIVSPEKLILSEDVRAVSVPGREGYFTVMGDHAPMMTTLKPGFVTVGGSDGNRTFYVKGGFADVAPEGLTILAEEAKTGDDFDPSEIEAEISAAREELEKASDAEAKNSAQSVLDGWMNLMMESSQAGNTVQI